MDVDRVAARGFVLTAALQPAYDSGPHRHARHQLLYAEAGALWLEGAGGQWLLPPQRAAWIPATLEHRVRCRRAARLCTAYLDPSLCLPPELAPVAAAILVFSVPPVCREMVLYGARWGPERDPEDPVAGRFFAALAGLCADWARAPLPWRLPVARSAELARAMEFLLRDLAAPLDVAGAARFAGVSTRTLARRFADETGASARQFLHTARMMRAMELLDIAARRVGEIAQEVGFDSQSAFTSAFKAFVGESPGAFRRRASAQA